MSDEDYVTPAPPKRIDRRAAIKKGVAGAAVAATGVAWSAPRVEGLSMRAGFAAAATGACSPPMVGVNYQSPFAAFEGTAPTVDCSGATGSWTTSVLTPTPPACDINANASAVSVTADCFANSASSLSFVGNWTATWASSADTVSITFHVI